MAPLVSDGAGNWNEAGDAWSADGFGTNQAAGLLAQAMSAFGSASASEPTFQRNAQFSLQALPLEPHSETTRYSVREYAMAL